MTVRDLWRRPGRARLVQVLVIVVGILAMHQMGGGNHRMAMPAAHVLAAAASPSGHESPRAHPADVRGAPTTSSLERNAAPVERAAAALNDVPWGTQAACVAVLLGLIALLLRLPVVARARPYGTPAVGVGHESGPLGRGPPRLLLAKLCVLRT